MRNNLTVYLIVAAVAVFFIGLIIYGRWWEQHGGGKSRREKEIRRKEERVAGSRARGWNYDCTIDGNIHYRIAGEVPGGQPWTIHYDTDQSSSSSTPKLIFTASTLGDVGYQWIIHDKKTFDIAQKTGVRMIVGGLSKLVGAFSDSTKVKRDFYLNAVIIASGSAEFRKRFVVAAMEPRWSSLLDREIEGLILNWPDFKQTMSARDNCCSAELAPHGLRVTLYCDAPEFAVIEQLAKLGQRLMEESIRINSATSTEPTVFNRKLIGD